MLSLFILPTCPYCRKVLNYLDTTDLNYNILNIDEKANYDEMIRLGGKRQVPLLFDSENNVVEEPFVKENNKIAPNITDDELPQTREETDEMFEKVEEVKPIESHQEETKEQIKIKNFDFEDDNEIVLPKLK